MAAIQSDGSSSQAEQAHAGGTTDGQPGLEAGASTGLAMQMSQPPPATPPTQPQRADTMQLAFAPQRQEPPAQQQQQQQPPLHGWGASGTHWDSASSTHPLTQ